MAPSQPSSPLASPTSPGKGSGFSAVASGPPIDFSFRELRSINDLLFESPVSGSPKHAPVSRDVAVNEYLDSITTETGSADEHKSGSLASPTAARDAASAPWRERSGKLNSTALRICNNNLLTLKGLDRVAHHLLDDPSELTWLDASCNQLTTIEDVVLKFPKLQVLYLHGNQISTVHDVLILSKLEHLQKLTLHGNPLSEKKQYKNWVCSHLPGLRSLDFSSITKLERDAIATWSARYLKQQEAKS